MTYFLFTQSDSLILLQMLSKYGKDSSVTQMVDKLDWVIMPVFNVDGYVFTQQVIRIKSHLYQTLNMFKRCLVKQSRIQTLRLRGGAVAKNFFSPPRAPLPGSATAKQGLNLLSS